MQRFINCPGLLKDEMIKTFRNAVKIEDRYYAIVDTTDTTLLQWRDEKTIVFIANKDKWSLQFWEKGKRIQQYTHEYNDGLGILTVCLEYYSALENTPYSSFL